MQLTEEQKALCRRLREDLEVTDVDTIAAADLIETLAAHNAGAQVNSIKGDGDTAESRAAFRNYDEYNTVRNRTPWQIWRDACAWMASRAAQPRPMDEFVPMPTGLSREEKRNILLKYAREFIEEEDGPISYFDFFKLEDEIEALKEDNATLLDSLNKECSHRCELEDKLAAITDAAEALRQRADAAIAASKEQS